MIENRLVKEQDEWAATRLAELRSSRGISQSRVGMAMGITGHRVSDIERGRYTLQWATIIRFLNVIGVSVDTFVAGCPGSFDRRSIPEAAKGIELEFIKGQIASANLDGEQLKELERYTKAERLKRAG